jgi:NhaP-type Na+/H+ or K+/H+ antiporter
MRSHEALTETALGVVVGVAVGFAGGFLLRLADRKRWTSAVSRQLFVLALAAACYLVAVGAGGNGFIAAFVGGLAFGGGSRGREESAVGFTETQGSLLAIGVWIAFGLTLAGRLLTDLWDPVAIIYATLSLTVIRMVPVAIALLGMRFERPTVLFIGWFGPRGLASIVFLIIGLESLQGAGVDAGPLGAVVAWTVLLSVVAHGLTAGPLAERYGKRVAGLPPGAPEHEDTLEPQAARTSWSGEKRPGSTP